MNTKVKYILDALNTSEVSVTDFSTLTSISRVTIYRWRNGGEVKDELRLNLAYNTAMRLNKAVQHQRLPLTDRLKKDQRVQVLGSIIREMSAK